MTRPRRRSERQSRLELRARSVAPGASRLEPRAWSLAPGGLCLEPRAWTLAPGASRLEPSGWSCMCLATAPALWLRRRRAATALSQSFSCMRPILPPLAVARPEATVMCWVAFLALSANEQSKMEAAEVRSLLLHSL